MGNPVDKSKNSLGVGPSGKKRWLSDNADDNADVRAGSAASASEQTFDASSAVTPDGKIQLTLTTGLPQRVRPNPAALRSALRRTHAGAFR